MGATVITVSFATSEMKIPVWSTIIELATGKPCSDQHVLTPRVRLRTNCWYSPNILIQFPVTQLNRVFFGSFFLHFLSQTDPPNPNPGRQGGSVGRVSDSRSKDPKDRRFEPYLCQAHNTNLSEIFRVKDVLLTRCRCAQTPCIYARTRIIKYAS